MTELVCAPKSFASFAQADHHGTTMVRAAGGTAAAGCGFQQCLGDRDGQDVSSIHSAGANPNGPPLFMVTSAPSGRGAGRRRS